MRQENNVSGNISMGENNKIDLLFFFLSRSSFVFWPKYKKKYIIQTVPNCICCCWLKFFLQMTFTFAALISFDSVFCSVYFPFVFPISCFFFFSFFSFFLFLRLHLLHFVRMNFSFRLTCLSTSKWIQKYELPFLSWFGWTKIDQRTFN